MFLKDQQIELHMAELYYSWGYIQVFLTLFIKIFAYLHSVPVYAQQLAIQFAQIFFD